MSNRIHLNTNTSTVENGYIADALVYVRFPAGKYSMWEILYNRVLYSMWICASTKHSPRVVLQNCHWMTSCDNQCVSLPGVNAHQKPSDVSLGFVLYQNDHFFKSRLYRNQRATIRVLSASIRGQQSSVVPQHVEMLFRPRVRKNIYIVKYFDSIFICRKSSSWNKIHVPRHEILFCEWNQFKGYICSFACCSVQ